MLAASTVSLAPAAWAAGAHALINMTVLTMTSVDWQGCFSRESCPNSRIGLNACDVWPLTSLLLQVTSCGLAMCLHRRVWVDALTSPRQPHRPTHAASAP